MIGQIEKLRKFAEQGDVDARNLLARMEKVNEEYALFEQKKEEEISLTARSSVDNIQHILSVPGIIPSRRQGVIDSIRAELLTWEDAIKKSEKYEIERTEIGAEQIVQ